MLLENKTIIITGVGPGMGSKLARLAASEGARVAMVARRTDLTSGIAAEVAAHGQGKAIAIAADVTRPEDCERVAKETLAAFGDIDGLINSAYFGGTMASVLEADLQEWRTGFDVTVFGAINMVRAVAPTLIARKRGAIVNVGTMETRKPLANNGQYNVPKAALHGLTRLLATELGPHNVRVNTAVPGWMWGDPVKEHFERTSAQTGIPAETLIAQVASQMVLGRIPSDEECAKSVLLLVSDYCLEVTGAALDINGGGFFTL